MQVARIRTAAMQKKKLYYVVILKPGSSNVQVLMTDISKVTSVTSTVAPFPPSPPSPPTPPPRPSHGVRSASLGHAAALLPLIASALLALFVL